MKYADTIRAAGLEVEPLMAWFIPWIGWSQPARFDRFLDGVRGRDWRLRGSKQLRVFDTTDYLDVLEPIVATSDTRFDPDGGPMTSQHPLNKITRYVVEPRRDVAILRIVPRNDPGYLVQPDKVGLLVAVDTEHDVLVESTLLCQRVSKDRPASGDNVVAYVFPDHRAPQLVMGIDPPRVGREFGWEIKDGEVVIVERFRTIGEFSIPSNRDSGTIEIGGHSFDVSNVRYEP